MKKEEEVLLEIYKENLQQIMSIELSLESLQSSVSEVNVIEPDTST